LQACNCRKLFDAFNLPTPAKSDHFESCLRKTPHGSKTTTLEQWGFGSGPPVGNARHPVRQNPLDNPPLSKMKPCGL
jgi:hypothetical protein